MFSEQDLNELVSFSSDRYPVLSVYLNVDSTKQTTEQYRLTLRSLLRTVSGSAHQADLAAVERYFDFEYDWQAKGVAVFSCQDAGFWRAFSLAVPVDNRAVVLHRPYLKPLTDVLDAYGRYGVVLVDREGARLFLFNVGALEEATGTWGEEVRRVKHGSASGVAGMRGGTDTRAARRGDATILRNLKEVAEATESFCSAHGCTRLVLGGSEATTGHFFGLLPKALQSKVVGNFTIDLTASVPEVQALSMELIEQLAEQRETALVEEAFSGWKRGIGATFGLSDTLAALQEHRASQILIAAGAEASGFRCSQCRYLLLTEHPECPLCGGRVVPVDDMVDAMTHRALEQGLDVEIVRGNRTLGDNGSVAALLRY